MESSPVRGCVNNLTYPDPSCINSPWTRLVWELSNISPIVVSKRQNSSCWKSIRFPRLQKRADMGNIIIFVKSSRKRWECRRQNIESPKENHREIELIILGLKGAFVISVAKIIGVITVFGIFSPT